MVSPAVCLKSIVALGHKRCQVADTMSPVWSDGDNNVHCPLFTGILGGMNEVVFM